MYVVIFENIKENSIVFVYLETVLIKNKTWHFQMTINYN